MLKENLVYLQENLKYLGFGENTQLTENLKEEVAKKNKEFQLVGEFFFSGDHKLETVLYFRKGDQSDIYFFNKYYALLRCGDDPEQDKGQTFYINKGAGITCKEAFNLLQGRAVFKNLVNKDGIKYNAWIQLDFTEKTMHNNYKTNQLFGNQFNIEQSLNELPILELKREDQKAHLFRSLQKGNLHQVHLDYGIKTEKGFITADPFENKITLFKATNGTEKPTRKKGTIVMPEAAISPDPDDGFDPQWEDEPQREGEGVLEAGEIPEAGEVLESSQVNEPENPLPVKKPAKKKVRKLE